MSEHSKDGLHQRAIDLLNERPLVSYSEESSPESISLTFPRQDDEGFDIEVQFVDGEIIILTAGVDNYRIECDAQAHQLVAQVLGVVRNLLSPHMRLRELSSGGSPYKWIVEAWNGEAWEDDGTTGLLVFNYFGKKTERIYVNRQLPGRLADVEPP